MGVELGTDYLCARCRVQVGVMWEGFMIVNISTLEGVKGIVVNKSIKIEKIECIE